jgi:hypothetical protein
MNSNPVHFLLDDQQYQLLEQLNLLNKKLLRDLEIRKHYHQMRARGLTFTETLECLLSDYPYLQPDTLRKLIYSRQVSRVEEVSRQLATLSEKRN